MTNLQNLPDAIYVWLVPSEEVQDQPGSWRIRKWDTEPFPEANFTLRSGPLGELERKVVDCAMDRLKQWHENEPEGLLPPDHFRGIPHGPTRALIEACLALEAARIATDDGTREQLDEAAAKFMRDFTQQ